MVDNFLSQIISRKELPLFNRLPNNTIERFNGAGRINRTTDILRILKQGPQVVPVRIPASADLRVFLIPAFAQLFKRESASSLVVDG
jgi:hypothetical protein